MEGDSKGNGLKRAHGRQEVQKAHRGLRMANGEKRKYALAELMAKLEEHKDSISPTLYEQILQDIQEERQRHPAD